MGHTLFQDWTDNMLQAAFAMASAEISARKKRKLKEDARRKQALVREPKVKSSPNL
ncbi:MAG: hypothetical protein AAFR02_00050 [Pseudomonadota bacterium]